MEAPRNEANHQTLAGGAALPSSQLLLPSSAARVGPSASRLCSLEHHSVPEAARMNNMIPMTERQPQTFNRNSPHRSNRNEAQNISAKLRRADSRQRKSIVLRLIFDDESLESLRFMRNRSLAATLKLLSFIFALLVFSSRHFGPTAATPLPSSVAVGLQGGSSKQGLAETNGAASSSSSIKSLILSQQRADGAESAASAAGGGGVATPSDSRDNNKLKSNTIGLGKANTAEKLKRGLASFMNQRNAAPFFVPAMQPGDAQAIQVAAAAARASGETNKPNLSSAEPATIVSSDSSLVLRSSANKWAYARPIGGPLRWGRRR